MKKRRIVTIIMIATLMVLALRAYKSATRPESGSPIAFPTSTPSPFPGYQGEAHAAAQATLVSGQSEIMELSQQANIISLDMDRAANAAAQATMDYNQRQLMELSIRATEVSQNMAQAAATQSQAATAAYSAYLQNVTQIEQAQAMLDDQANQRAQANAALTAYSLTATPWAVIQSEIARTQNEAKLRTLWGDLVVTPLKVVLLTLIVLLLIVGAVIVYWRLTPLLELRLRTISRNSPLLVVDGMIVGPDPPRRRLKQLNLRLLKHRHSGDETSRVEIIGSSEPFLTNWIAEAEQNLRISGRMY
jgi:hypothetical protein